MLNQINEEVCGFCGQFFGADDDGLGACALNGKPCHEEQRACEKWVDEEDYLCPEAR